MVSLREFYTGRSIMVTGGTGFMGKVLLEKMIRCLPGIKNIYVLLRAKKGSSPEERIEDITTKMPFTFNNINADTIKKLIAVHCDVTKDNLGLSDSDRQTIIDEVSVVFHMAASIRMDLSLKDAVIQNTISTQRVLRLCTELKNLVSVVHLSTAYCNVDVEYMEEKVYKTKIDSYKVIELVQWLDDDNLAKIQKSIMEPHPNSYTFSKRLAEIIAVDMGKNLPLSIGRPSIVIPSLNEPTPGWIDNINGPVGILIAAGKGVMRSMLGEKKNCPQFIPVDAAINGLITMACTRATDDFTQTPIYNLTQGDIAKMSWKDTIDKFRNLAERYPLKSMLWYPGGDITTNKFLHYFMVIFCHMIPAYVIDMLLFLFLQEPFLVNVQSRLNHGLKLLSYFTLKQFTFTNENTHKLAKCVHPEDVEDFTIIRDHYDIDQYMFNAFVGANKFCLNDNMQEDMYWRRLLIAFLYILDRFSKFMLVFGLIWVTLYACNATHLLSYNVWLGKK